MATRSNRRRGAAALAALLAVFAPPAAAEAPPNAPEPSFWDRLLGREPEPQALVAATESETFVAYDVELVGAPSEAVEATARQALRLYQERENGAASLPLLGRRAEADAALMLKILRAEGYYRGAARVELQEPSALAAARAAAAAEARAERVDAETGRGPLRDGPEPPPRATVRLVVEPGPRFTLAEHRFTPPAEAADTSGFDVAELDAASLGSPVGAAAVAADIVRAEAAAVRELRRAGFPYAASAGRRTTADVEGATLRVASDLASGPRVVYGPIDFIGLESVERSYLESYVPWTEGAPLDAAKLGLYQRLLSQTDLFKAASVTFPTSPPSPGADGVVVAPITVTLEEGPRRSVGGSARFSTDAGPAARGSFEHRNLFGRNETLTVVAEAEAETQLLGFGLRRPQFLRPGQELVGALTGSHTEGEQYDETALEARLGVLRRVSPRLNVSLAADFRLSQLVDDDFEGLALIGGLPATLDYDGSDDRLDPREGFRLSARATPSYALLDAEAAPYLTLDARLAVYLPLDHQKRWVLAGRSRVASILSEQFRFIPASERLYAGGGASVRGYGEDEIGPLDASGAASGGRSAVEVGGELRGPIMGDLGFALFVEAGAVDEKPTPNFQDRLHAAAGLGLRYASPVGPIRVDVAAPIEARDIDERYQIYFSIGQAF